MKSFLFVAFATLLLATSCQKEALIEPALSQVDHREQLVGTYEGTLTYQDVVTEENNSNPKTISDVLENQTVEIAKAPDSDYGLIIDCNPLNIVPQSSNDIN